MKIKSSTRTSLPVAFSIVKCGGPLAETVPAPSPVPIAMEGEMPERVLAFDPDEYKPNVGDNANQATSGQFGKLWVRAAQNLTTNCLL